MSSIVRGQKMRPASNRVTIMDFDFDKFYKRLEKQMRGSSDFVTSLKQMMEGCAAQMPHKTWSTLATIDVSKEVRAAKRWIPRVLEREPCPFPVRGAYFGLSEYVSKGAEYANLYFGLMSAYDPRDADSNWLFAQPRHYPDKAHLNSKAIKQGGLLCAGEDNLGTPGLIAFSISFCALLLRHALDPEIYRTLGGNAPIGVITGYDSGDLLRLGEITAEGFAPNQSDFV